MQIEIMPYYLFQSVNSHVFFTYNYALAITRFMKTAIFHPNVILICRILI